MAYSEAAPSMRLAPFVERLCFSSDEGGGAPAPVRVVPDGAIDVLFSVARDGSSDAHVFGLKTRPLWVETADPRDNVLLRLRPGAAARLFRVDAHELTDRAPELDSLAGRVTRELRERVAEARSSAERARAIELGFGAWAQRAAQPLDGDDALLHAAVSHIRRNRGALRIAALADSLGVGTRRLERLFLARVGAAPKAFARIARFSAAYQSLARGRDPLEAALDHGYFDQAHLNRDFRELAGGPPRRIFPSERAAGPDSLRA